MSIGSALTMVTGTLNFRSITGGSGSGTVSQHGVSQGAQIIAPAIIASDIYGGPGTGGDYGWNIAAALGDASITHMISISAGSLGTGGNEIGIYNSGNTITVNDGGTITLVGTGGGLYSGSGGGNYGISLTGVDLIAGSATGTGVNTINLTGIGGQGGGGSHYGVDIAGTNTFQLQGTNVYNSINFLNCVGGSGSSGGNYGMDIGGSISMANGTLTFTNITGGSGGTRNHGVFITSMGSVSAPVLIATDCVGAA